MTPSGRLAGFAIVLMTAFVVGCGSSAASAPSIPGGVTRAPTPEPTAGWLSYHSAANHITFKHPSNWVPLECGWVYVGTLSGQSSNVCPTDGAGGLFLAASDNGQTGGFSSISSNPQLYAHLKRTSVTVNGVVGMRVSADQITGQGGGSSQVEYKFTAAGRSFTFLAYTVWPGYQAGDLTAQFDHLVQSVIFGS